MPEKNPPRPRIHRISLENPTLGDNRADRDRVLTELCKQRQVDHIRMNLELDRELPQHLRENSYRLKCVCFSDHSTHIVGLRAEGSPRPLLGMAIDLGTTRVVVRCVDLETETHLGETTFDNPQISIAPDILARIHEADKPGGLQNLQNLIVNGINDAFLKLSDEANIDLDDICLITVAGNTTMSHLLLGLEPRWIIREPYIPVVNSFDLISAKQLGLRAGAGAQVFVFPNIGSYFGGDLIAGILFSGMYQQEETAILVDVGTNAEVVLGNRGWLLACAGAAGPALEGGAASMGMMAAPGVIDHVSMGSSPSEFNIHTIGEKPPIGICGSGLIDLAATLFRAQLLDIRGVLDRDRCGKKYVEKDGIGHFVVVPKEESATGEDLVISQPEFDSLIRSKAAMYTILETISASIGLTPSDFEAFYVAGTFGSFIDPRSAITIGMLPDLPTSVFKPLGNSSLGGATEALISEEKASEIKGIRDSITYMELNVNQEFMNRFSAAKFLPHTEASRFPSVKF